MSVNPTRRRFFGLAGAAAAAAATAGVPSLEAQTAREFGRGGHVLTESLGSHPGAASLGALRREMIGETHPFFAEAPVLDPYAIDYSKATAADIGDDGVDRPFQYEFPVVASGAGANGSFWMTQIKGRVAGEQQANIRARLTPRGVVPSGSDPLTETFYVDGSHAIRWDDPVNDLFGASGTAWMLVESDVPLTFDPSYTFNQAADGSQQGQALPTFDLETVMQDSRLSHAGDVSRFEIYGLEHGQSTPGKRENWLIISPEASGAAQLDYWIEDSLGSQKTATKTLWSEGGTYKQLNGLHSSFSDYVPRPGDSLVVRTKATDEADVAVFQVLSHADNLFTDKQDPWSNTGSKKRGIEDAFVHVNDGENNDPAAYQIRVSAGNSGHIIAVQADWNGNGTVDNTYDNIDEAEFEMTNIGAHNSVPGTYKPRITVIAENPTTGQFARTFEGREYTVTAEPDDYTPGDSYAKTQANIAALATLIGGNINTVFTGTSTHFDVDEVRNILEVYTNGTTGDQNPELDRVIIKDGTNSVDFRRTDGGTAVWAGFTGRQMDALIELYR